MAQMRNFGLMTGAQLRALLVDFEKHGAAINKGAMTASVKTQAGEPILSAAIIVRTGAPTRWHVRCVPGIIQTQPAS